MSMLTTLGGIALATTGAAHFVAPQAFVDVTRKAFPDDTDRWIQINGATELALGLGLLARPTRKIALAGLAAYVGHLGYRGAEASQG